jgi:hypothetical protein
MLVEIEYDNLKNELLKYGLTVNVDDKTIKIRNLNKISIDEPIIVNIPYENVVFKIKKLNNSVFGKYKNY